MPQSPRQSGDDERIDDYVCGRLTPEDEQEFEDAFIGNPGLVKKIEEAYALKQCLVEAKEQGAFIENKAPSWLKKCWDYFAVPQTAWGAIAAACLVVPLSLQIYQSRLLEDDKIFVALPEHYDFRTGVVSIDASYYVGRLSDQTLVVFVLSVPSAYGESRPWDVQLLDANGQVIWSKSNQPNDGQSKIYIKVAREILVDKEYTYNIFSKEKNNVSSGKIQIGEQ